MSDYVLKEDEKAVLLKGLKFCPTPKSVDNDEFAADINAYCRRLRLCEFFDDEATNDNSLVRQASSWQPNCGRDENLDSVINFLVSSSENLIKCNNYKGCRRSNVSKTEWGALETLKHSKMIIKQADKGSAIVLMNSNFYKEKILDLLNDQDTYKVIPHNMDITIINKIKLFSKKYKDQLTKEEAKYIYDFNYSTSNFYGLPKIHKSRIVKNAVNDLRSEIISVREPVDLKLRPIVAGPSCPTHKLSHLVDLILHPYVRYVEANIKNSVELINKLPVTLNEDDTFLTIDVSSLYTSITHELGVEAVAYFINKYPEIQSSFSVTLIVDAVTLILKNNTFVFNGTNYIQTKGTAMGTKFAPNYATLTLGFLEIRLFHVLTVNLGHTTASIIKSCYYRYLDDVFCIWNLKFGPDSLVVDLLNSLNKNLSFINDQKGDTVSFLDINIIKTINNDIETDIHYKETDSKQYLDYKSNHPRYVKNNIPYNLARRICTIVSNNKVKIQRLIELFDYLVKRNYPVNIIKEGLLKAWKIPQANLRQETKKQENENLIPFIVTNNKNLPSMTNIVKQSFNVLKCSSSLKTKLKNKKVIISKRQPPNLRTILTKARFNENTEQATVKKCKNAKCKLCKIIIEGNNFHFSSVNLTFTIKTNMNCNVKYCIYAILCSNCKYTYIGETKDFRLRTNLHREHTREGAGLYVNQHLNRCANKNFLIMPIYKMKTENSQDRHTLEKKFIAKYKPELNKDT